MKKGPNERKVKGTEVSSLGTLGGSYHISHGYINVHTKDFRTLRIHVSELLKMFEHFEFDQEWARSYMHLKNPKLKER